MEGSLKRSAPFAESQQQEAKETARRRHKTVEFWYRRKYGLTINDPRFLDATTEEMLADYWSHTYEDDPKALEEVVDEDFDENDVARLIGADIPPEGDDWEPLS